MRTLGSFYSLQAIYARVHLENFGSLDLRKDLVSPNLTCKHTETIWSQHGNSYLQNVLFNDVDLSRSVMPPGISDTEPRNNSHYNDLSKTLVLSTNSTSTHLHSRRRLYSNQQTRVVSSIRRISRIISCSGCNSGLR